MKHKIVAKESVPLKGEKDMPNRQLEESLWAQGFKVIAGEDMTLKLILPSAIKAV